MSDLDYTPDAPKVDSETESSYGTVDDPYSGTRNAWDAPVKHSGYSPPHPTDFPVVKKKSKLPKVLFMLPIALIAFGIYNNRQPQKSEYELAVEEYSEFLQQAQETYLEEAARLAELNSTNKDNPIGESEEFLAETTEAVLPISYEPIIDPDTDPTYRQIITEFEDQLSTYGITYLETTDANGTLLSARLIEPNLDEKYVSQLNRLTGSLIGVINEYRPEAMRTLTPFNLSLVNELAWGGGTYSGAYNHSSRTIYVDADIVGYTTLTGQRALMHHELWHAIEFINNDRHTPVPEWTACNDNVTSSSGSLGGYLNDYSKTNEYEDKAEVFEGYVLRKEYVERVTIADPALKCKLDVLKSMTTDFGGPWLKNKTL